MHWTRIGRLSASMTSWQLARRGSRVAFDIRAFELFDPSSFWICSASR